MTEFFCELRRTVERSGPLTYVPLDDLERHTGFRSVFCVDAALRDHILRQGSVGGLDQAPVYAETLFVDYDSDDGVEAAVAHLRSLDISFSLWDTGRRGVHLHIACVPMLGRDVPHSQYAWAHENLVGDWDHTVYRHHSIIRLPGTFHEKNPGHCKRRLEIYGGKQLAVPRRESPVPLPRPAATLEPKQPGEFWSAVLAPAAQRTYRLYHLGCLAAECGVDYDEGLEAVRSWAHTVASPPLTNEREISRVFNNGYSKGGRV